MKLTDVNGKTAIYEHGKLPSGWLVWLVVGLALFCWMIVYVIVWATT